MRITLLALTLTACATQEVANIQYQNIETGEILPRWSEEGQAIYKECMNQGNSTVKALQGASAVAGTMATNAALQTPQSGQSGTVDYKKCLEGKGLKEVTL